MKPASIPIAPIFASAVLATACTAATAEVAAPGADEGPVVRNGSFEEFGEDGKPLGWGLLSGGFRIGGGGINGSRGLFRSNDDPDAPGAALWQDIHLRRGSRYRCHAWIKDFCAPGGEGARIRVEWSDAEGVTLGGLDFAPLLMPSISGWREHGAELAGIPAEASRIRVGILVGRGMVGTVSFDDIEITLLPPRGTVTLVYSSAYRNLAAEGEVTFGADVEDAGGLPPGSVRLRYRDSGGEARERPMGADGHCRLPVADLAMGAQRVGVAVVDESGAEIGFSDLAFTRVEKLPERAVYFDAQGRAIVGGKPFFPLGMYTGELSTNDVDRFADSPFNCVLSYSPPRQPLLDYFAVRGLKLIPSMAAQWKEEAWFKGSLKSTEDEEARIRDIFVPRYKDHPAMLAWYTNDEKPVTWMPRLVRRRDLLERLDPDHPCYTVVYQIGQIGEYLPSYDVVGSDPYPIPYLPASRAVMGARLTKVGARGCKPVWMVPQCMDWAAYPYSASFRGLESAPRPPTAAEMRSMLWQCIAAGANGLILYSYEDMTKEPNGVPFQDRWDDCCRVAAEIERYMPVLLADEPSGDESIVAGVACDPPSVAEPCGDMPVETRAWLHEGEAWLLVVNASAEPATPTISLRHPVAAARREVGPEPTLAPDGRSLTVTLPPLDHAIVRLAP